MPGVRNWTILFNMSTSKRMFKAIKSFIFIIIGLLVLGAATIAILFINLDRTNGEIISSGQERTYLLHVPSAYDPQKPVPLVISMHGFAEWPAHLMKISGWNDLAEQYGFIVVYPSGTGFPRRWDATGSSMMDVKFISDLIDKLESDYNIDSTRIYANGLSNGAGMSYLLICEMAERIAAIGGVSGAFTYPLDECNPSRPVPMIVIQGNNDPIVPYEGESDRHEGFDLPNIPEWVAARAVINNCVADSTILLADGAVNGVKYSVCDGGADVVLYTIEGGGHAWPGGDPMPVWLVGYTSQDIDATQMMWDFFTQFSLGD